ncbi:MAG: hypothetical protein LBP76_12060 [Treponema sp.]|jgi:hypothetical protein|nr:hypothetical protein [Treponema sp.]
MMYNAETFDMFESLVMQRKKWELKARENEMRSEELEQKLRKDGML